MNGAGRLYRDPRNGCIAGVCAGLADYLGQEVGRVRIIAIILAIFFLPYVVCSYVGAVIFVTAKPEGPAFDTAEGRFRRTVGTRPAVAFSDLATRFKRIDERMIAVERYVTSAEFKLDRDFKNSAIL